MSRSETAEGGSSVSYRPAVSETVRLAQSRRSVSLPSRPAMSRSEKSRVAAPAHAERSRSADLAFSSTRPVGWSCRCRTPAEVPRKGLFSSCSANPCSFLPSAGAAPNGSPFPPPGRGPEEGAVQLVPAAPVQLPARSLGRTQGLAERGREIAHHADFGQAWSGVPPGVFIIFLARAEQD